MPVATPTPPLPDTPAINYSKTDTSCTWSDVSVQDPTLQTSTLEKFERTHSARANRLRSCTIFSRISRDAQDTYMGFY